MKELTDEIINKKEKDSDGSGESKNELESLSGTPVNRFYAKDRQALRKWFEENHSTSTGTWMIYDKKASGKRKRILTRRTLIRGLSIQLSQTYSFRIFSSSIRAFSFSLSTLFFLQAR
jgi:hypothetical protein